MILFIDTTKKQMIRLELRKKKQVVDEFEKKTDQMSEEILTLLDSFLKKNRITVSDLEKIEVNPGPGPFSQVRTGVAVANALNFTLGLSKDMVEPVYDKEPNITTPPSPSVGREKGRGWNES